MKHTWKKTVAFVMALGLVTSAMPPSMGSYLAETSRNIVAHAESAENQSVTVEVKEDAVILVGQTMKIPEVESENVDMIANVMVNATDKIQLKAGGYVLPEFEYSDNLQQYATKGTFHNHGTLSYNKISFSVELNEEKGDAIIGIRCISGDGTTGSPFVFAPIIKRNIGLGTVYNVGDVINLTGDTYMSLTNYYDEDDKAEIKAGGYTLPAFEMDYIAHTSPFLSPTNAESEANNLRFDFRQNTEWKYGLDTITGIRCTGGSGTAEDPYTFEPVVTKVLQGDRIGTEYYIGDTISLLDGGESIACNIGSSDGISVGAGDYVLPEFELDGDYLKTSSFLGENNFIVDATNFPEGTRIIGIRCTGGIGTPASPCTFEPITEKSPAVDTVYNIGDKIKVDSGDANTNVYVRLADSENATAVPLTNGSYKLPAFSGSGNTQSTVPFLNSNGTRVSLTMGNSTPLTSNSSITGIKCTGGTGTEQDPYVFEPIVKDDIVVGGKYFIDDIIPLANDSYIKYDEQSTPAQIQAGKYKLPGFDTYSTEGVYYYYTMRDFLGGCVFKLGYGTGQAPRWEEVRPIGVKCTGGDGTESEPYTFEPIFQRDLDIHVGRSLDSLKEKDFKVNIDDKVNMTGQHISGTAYVRINDTEQGVVPLQGNYELSLAGGGIVLKAFRQVDEHGIPVEYFVPIKDITIWDIEHNNIKGITFNGGTGTHDDPYTIGVVKKISRGTFYHVGDAMWFDGDVDVTVDGDEIASGIYTLPEFQWNEDNFSTGNFMKNINSSDVSLSTGGYSSFTKDDTVIGVGIATNLEEGSNKFVPVKKARVGAVYNVGDIFHVDEKTYVLNSDGETLKVYSGTYFVPQFRYDKDTKEYRAVNYSDWLSDLILPYAGEVSQDLENETISSIRIVKGDGTEENPFVFAPSIEKDLKQGSTYYVGDTIVAENFTTDNCGRENVGIQGGKYTLPEFTYYEGEQTQVFRTVEEFLTDANGDLWEFIFEKGNHSSDDKVIGVKCTSFEEGKATFEPIFADDENSPAQPVDIGNTTSTVKGSTVTVSYNGNTLKQDVDYTITYFDDKSNPISQPQLMGTYYYKLTGIGNYTGETSKEKFDLGARVMTASLTLTDGFEMNFNTSIPADDAEELSHYSVKFEGKCYEADNEFHALTNNNGQGCITACLNANDINEPVTVKFYYDGDLIHSATFKGSVNDYLNKLRSMDGEAYENYRNMALATQFYGLAAENYFNGKGNNLEDMFTEYKRIFDFYNDTIKARANEMCGETLNNDTVPPELKVSLVLNSKAKLRVYHDNGETLGIYGKYSEATGLTPITMGESQEVAGYNLSGYTWVKRVLNNSGADQKNTDMAYAMFAYMDTAVKYQANQAVENHVINLGELTADYTAKDGDILTGKLNSAALKVTIADNATVTLKGADITTYENAGIAALGNATIILEQRNIVTSMGDNAGISVPANKTLTIMGNGELYAQSHTGAGIGSGYSGTCGNIVIEGGHIEAHSDDGAGIGCGVNGTCGAITIKYGNVRASSGDGAGIGCGVGGTCSAVTIYGTVSTNIKAYSAKCSIGAGSENSSCGPITIKGKAYAQNGFNNEFIMRNGQMAMD